MSCLALFLFFSSAKNVNLLLQSPLADLKTYCDNHKIKYTLFKDWTVVKGIVEKVSAANLTPDFTQRKSAKHDFSLDCLGRDSH